jgi:hypothetical protein
MSHNTSESLDRKASVTRSEDRSAAIDHPDRWRFVRYCAVSGLAAAGAAIIASWPFDGATGAVVWIVVAAAVTVCAGLFADSLMEILSRDSTRR